MKIIRSKVINIDNQQITILLCKYKYVNDYDVIVASVNIVLLEKVKKLYDLNSDIILDSIFGKPMLVVDSYDSFSYGIPLDSLFGYFSALRVFRRHVMEIRDYLK